MGKNRAMVSDQINPIFLNTVFCKILMSKVLPIFEANEFSIFQCRKAELGMSLTRGSFSKKICKIL